MVWFTIGCILTLFWRFFHHANASERLQSYNTFVIVSLALTTIEIFYLASTTIVPNYTSNFTVTWNWSNLINISHSTEV